MISSPGAPKVQMVNLFLRSEFVNFQGMIVFQHHFQQYPTFTNKRKRAIEILNVQYETSSNDCQT